MERKRRLSVSVDAKLMEAAQLAVKHGQAPTLSAYVSQGLRLKLESDEQLRAMDRAIRAYEAEFGVITKDDMEDAVRNMQARAIHVRTRRPTVKETRGSQAGSPADRKYSAKAEATRTTSRASERRSGR